MQASFPLLEVPPSTKATTRSLSGLFDITFQESAYPSSFVYLWHCNVLSRVLPRVGPSGGGTPPRPRSGSWSACGSGSSSNTRGRDLGLESAAGAAHDQGRGASSGRGAGSDSGSVVGQRQHWKTGATVVPTATHCQTAWAVSSSQHIETAEDSNAKTGRSKELTSSLHVSSTYYIYAH
ncbi:hypothetical protein ARMSODRAFT_976418 [Armillaria solidipes]|uniref:Uncharacterized protein n=1 Tax=Armillaria solidipes TaxID=1076256 RepID=A0A2H3B9W6_9AGAR|nr:hypothetical protein ARMSODRAFT_976418 [Armillaria solidipes]